MAKTDKGKPEIDLSTTAEDLASDMLTGVAAQANETAALLDTQRIEVNTMNEFGLGGQATAIRPIRFPEFTTRQQAWRFAAWLKLMAETLPDEVADHSFSEIEDAIMHARS